MSRTSQPMSIASFLHAKALATGLVLIGDVTPLDDTFHSIDILLCHQDQLVKAVTKLLPQSTAAQEVTVTSKPFH